MITAGVDVGLETIKVVILKDSKVLARSTAPSGGIGRRQAAESAWQEALKSAGISATDVKKVVATGQGKLDVAFAAECVVEPLADAKAARFLFPQAKAVVDAGADQVRVANFDSNGKITEIALNQKCAAGIGTFLESIAGRLGLTLEEMSLITGKAAGVAVNDGCAVFAEMDAIGMLHDNVPKSEIVKAIHEAMATRISAVLNDKVIPAKDTTVLVGGLALNQGIVSALKKRSGIKFMIPEQPQFAGAMGAALIAAS